MLMFASYSYLGLIGHPKINAAAEAALAEFGTGTHGVRLLAGTLKLHGWVYKIETGDVFAYDPAAEQFAPITDGMGRPTAPPRRLNTRGI